MRASARREKKVGSGFRSVDKKGERSFGWGGASKECGCQDEDDGIKETGNRCDELWPRKNARKSEGGLKRRARN